MYKKVHLVGSYTQIGYDAWYTQCQITCNTHEPCPLKSIVPFTFVKELYTEIASLLD